MREHGLTPLPLTFCLDPEGGFESNNILPEPKFRQIDQWLEASFESKHEASLAYHPNLDDAVHQLRNLPEPHHAVTGLSDAATVLHYLVDKSADLSIEKLSEELRLKMSVMPIFRGLTLDHLCSKRAQTFLQLHIQSWVERL